MNRSFVPKGGIAFGYKDEKTGTKIGVFLKIFLNGRAYWTLLELSIISKYPRCGLFWKVCIKTCLRPRG